MAKKVCRKKVPPVRKVAPKMEKTFSALLLKKKISAKKAAKKIMKKPKIATASMSAAFLNAKAK